MATAQTVVDRARVALLDTSSKTKLSDVDALEAINKYLDSLQEELVLWEAREIIGSHHSETNSDLALVSGQEVYDLPSDFLAPMEPFVYLNQAPLYPISDYYIERWRNETGQPLYWCLRNVDGNKKLILLPVPDDDAVTNYSPIKLYYFKKIDSLTDLSQDMPFGGVFDRDAEEYLILFAKLRIAKATSIDFSLRMWVSARVFEMLSLQRPDMDITSSSRLIDLCNYEI